MANCLFLLPWCKVIAGYRVSSNNSNSQPQPTTGYRQTSKSLPGTISPTRVKTTTNTIYVWQFKYANTLPIVLCMSNGFDKKAGVASYIMSDFLPHEQKNRILLIHIHISLKVQIMITSKPAYLAIIFTIFQLDQWIFIKFVVEFTLWYRRCCSAISLYPQVFYETVRIQKWTLISHIT